MEAKVCDEKCEAVLELYYFGDMLSAGGGCELHIAAATLCKSPRDFLFFTLQSAASDHMSGVITCAKSVMMHVAETWAIIVATLNRFRLHDYT